jgi:hypothetical protein
MVVSEILYVRMYRGVCAVAREYSCILPKVVVVQVKGKYGRDSQRQRLLSSELCESRVRALFPSTSKADRPCFSKVPVDKGVTNYRLVLWGFKSRWICFGGDDETVHIALHTLLYVDIIVNPKLRLEGRVLPSNNESLC